MLMIRNLLNPITEYAPVTFWSLNDKLNTEEMERQLLCFKEAGFGGVFLHSRVGLITLYMSDEWLDLIANAVRFGASLGLEMYLYDEDMWPSGYGGGIVPKKDNDFCEKALLYIDKNHLTENDRIIKKHSHKYIVARTTPCVYTRFNGGCFIDEMNPKAVRYFLETTHEKYFQKMGTMFGREIKGIFTDEPCYNLHSFHAEPHTPFSEYAVDRYERQTGKKFLDGCHLLFCEEDGYRQFRLDYYKAASEQFEEAFCKQYSDWCKAHGIELVGHLMAEETLADQVAYTGGVMRNYKHFGVAGVDKLFRTNDQTLTLKQLTSVTEMFAKKRALSECFAGMGQDTTFIERKRVVDWQAINGINFVNTHLSHYSMRGERKRDYPPNLNYQQPYFTSEKWNNAYIARLSRIIAESKRIVNVLIIEPYSTAVLEYNPNDYNKELYVDKILTELTTQLEKNRVEYHLITEEDFAAFARVEGDTIFVNGYHYQTLILPAVKNINNRGYEKLKTFCGNICKIGAEIGYVDGIEQETDINGSYFMDVPAFVAEGLPYLKKVCDINGQIDGIIATKRLLDGKEVLFLSNKSTQNRTFTLLLDKEYSVVSLMEGKIYSLKDKIKDNTLKLTLYAAGSIMLYEGDIGLECLQGDYANDGICFERSAIFDSLAFSIMERPQNNIMVLDRVSLYVNNKLVVADSPTNAVWHYHYYKLDDGTPFTAKYKFTVKDIPKSKVVALIENAENYDLITLNGCKLIPQRAFNERQIFDNKCQKDISLTVCSLDFPLQKGENVLQIEGRKYNNISEVCGHRWVDDKEYAATEVENIFLVGDFTVVFENHLPCIAATKIITTGDIASEGYPFYSGEIVYKCDYSFSSGDEIQLQGDFASAEIEVEGVKYVLTNTPYSFVFKKECKQITVRVFNTLYPMYGPHRLKGYDEKVWIDAGIHNEINEVTEEYRIVPFGLKKILKKN